MINKITGQGVRNQFYDKKDKRPRHEKLILWLTRCKAQVSEIIFVINKMTGIGVRVNIVIKQDDRHMCEK